MAVYTHILDTCPGPRPCSMEMDSDWTTLKRFIRLCPHHQSLRDDGLDDQALLRAHRASWNLKETARALAKSEMALDKEVPGIPFRVEPNGDFVIETGLKGQPLTRLKTLIAQALSTIEKPVGTSQVTVE